MHLLEGKVLLNSDVKFIREWRKGTVSMTSGSRKVPHVVELE